LNGNVAQKSYRLCGYLKYLVICYYHSIGLCSSVSTLPTSQQNLSAD